jgi:ribosomal protein L14
MVPVGGNSADTVKRDNGHNNDIEYGMVVLVAGNDVLRGSGIMAPVDGNGSSNTYWAYTILILMV